MQRSRFPIVAFVAAVISLALSGVALAVVFGTLIGSARSPLQAVTVAATTLSAVGTLASAIVIAVQAVLTRQSLEVAQRALDRANADSNFALQERLDAQMPFVNITCSEWDAPVERIWSAGTAMTVTPRQTDFDRTDAAGDAQLLTITTYVHVVNDGPGSVDLRWGAQHDRRYSGQQRNLIRPSGALSLDIDRTHSVSEWREYARRAVRGEPTDVVIFDVAYFSPGNVGAIDNWEVKSGGSILSPVPGESTSVDPVHWQITPEASRATSPYPTRPEPQPFVRRYWADRLGNVPLDFGTNG